MPLAHVFMGVCVRQTPDAGWVSIYYPGGGDYQPCLDNLQSINTAELQLLHNSVSCPRIFVSDLKVPGDILPGDPATKFGQAVSAAGATDPSVALVIKQVASPTQRSTRFIRGVPNAMYNSAEVAHFTFAPPNDVQLTAYLAQLSTGFQLYSRPGIRNQGNDKLMPIQKAFTVASPGGIGLQASIRRAGRPFALRHGRRTTG